MAYREEIRLGSFAEAVSSIKGIAPQGFLSSILNGRILWIIKKFF